jgi:hypothetical protein
MIAFSSGAIRSMRQPCACRPISSSSSSLRSSAAYASERVPGHLVLVERERRGAALVGATGHTG